MQRLEQMLDDATAQFPDRLALIFEGRQWTYMQMLDEVNRRAALFVAMGLAPGAVVASVGKTTDESILTFYACGRAGLTYFHLSPKLTDTELAPLLARAGAACVLTPDGTPHSACPALPVLPFAQPGNPDDAASAEAMRRSHTDMTDAPVVIQTTSGSTGVPKLVPLPHAYFARMRDTPVWWEQPGEIVATVAPFHFPTRIMPRVALLGGTFIVSHSPDPAALESLIMRHHVTMLWTVPAVARLLADNPAPPPTLPLRVIRIGAAPLPPPTARALVQRYGVDVVREYGSSEGNIITYTSADSPLESVGRLYSGLTDRLVNPDGTDVPEGEAGELIVRGPGMMRGYLNDPDATAQALRDGWLWTGDLARRDAHGNYFILGRTRLQINVAGQKVSPEEVERVLETHPQIREAAVLAAADEVRGEVVRAIIVPCGEPPTVKAVQQFCRERLADYKIPRIVEYRNDLPRSPLSKVLRHLL